MTFTIGAPPVLSVTALSTGQPVFTWSDVQGAANYDLWVNLDGGQAQVIRLETLTSTAYTPPVPLAAGTYRAWVRAISDMDERTRWSNEVVFEVTAATAGPFAPQLSADLKEVDVNDAADTDEDDVTVTVASRGALPAQRNENEEVDNAANDRNVERVSQLVQPARQTQEPFDHDEFDAVMIEWPSLWWESSRTDKTFRA